MLARGLAARHVPTEVVFLTDHGPHPMRAALDSAGIHHWTLPHSSFSLLPALRQRRPALLHTHGYKAGILGRLAARALGIPVVSTFHAGEPGTGRLRVYFAVDRATAALADCIAVSDAIRKRLPAKTHLIENFVELPQLTTRATGRRPPVVAFVGRVNPEKGPDEFCAVARLLPDVAFVIYGDGPMRADLQAQHGARVQFRGMVASMAEHWRDIGLLCMPSRHEGLPMAALEAMAHQVPVAAYAVGGLPRIITHEQNGWLAPPGDRAALAAAITAWRSQSDAEALAIGEAARAVVMQHFSVAAAIDRILAVYAGRLETSFA
jgi:glycosyltransferase involved in cell wall biosynthesis